MDGHLIIPRGDDFQDSVNVPNLDIVDSVRKIYYESWVENPGSSSFKSAYAVFMCDAILILHAYGNHQKAREYLEQAKREFPEDAQNRLSVDDFVLARWRQNLGGAGWERGRSIINGYLNKYCVALASGDTLAAAGQESVARKVYEAFKLERAADWVANGLPPYEEMKTTETNRCLKEFKPEVAKLLSEALSASK